MKNFIAMMMVVFLTAMGCVYAPTRDETYDDDYYEVVYDYRYSSDVVLDTELFKCAVTRLGNSFISITWITNMDGYWNDITASCNVDCIVDGSSGRWFELEPTRFTYGTEEYYQIDRWYGLALKMCLNYMDDEGWT